MKKMKRIGIAVLAAALAAAAGGCGKEVQEAEVSKYAPGEVSYPMQTDETVTYWVGLNSAISKIVTTAGDTQYAKNVKEKTGINVEFIHPAQGQEETKFNLLLASGSMPDIISWDWLNLSENIDALIDKGYIAKINDLMEDYAPNMTKYIKSIDGLDKRLQTDSGNYFLFPYIRDTDDVCVYCGPIIRKDWLDEIGMEAPETIDEWHEMLTKFKETKGIEPFLSIGTRFLDNGMFIGAFGTTKAMYVDGGKVVYGPATENYKQAISTLAQWYSEGLINQNFVSMDAATLSSKMLNNQVGATYGYNASGIGTWLANGTKGGGSFNLVAAKYPTLEKGQTPMFGQKQPIVGEFYDCVISGGSTKKELAARYLDYAFTEEGHMLQHFGIEGESYNMVDGVPTYTELITNNPDGKTMSEALSYYTHTTYSQPGYSNSEAFKQQLTYPQQLDALDKWSQTDAGEHQLPPLSMPTEEINEYSKIMGDIETYVDDTTSEFIMGVKPISEFDEFFETLKSLGIERAVELKQTAYDRYLSR